MQQRLTAERQSGTDAIFSPLTCMTKASQANAPRSGFMSNKCFKIIVWVQADRKIAFSDLSKMYNIVYIMQGFKEPDVV